MNELIKAINELKKEKNAIILGHYYVGPATENGFYYDVDLGDQKLSDEDLDRKSTRLNSSHT